MFCIVRVDYSMSNMYSVFWITIALWLMNSRWSKAPLYTMVREHDHGNADRPLKKFQMLSHVNSNIINVWALVVKCSVKWSKDFVEVPYQVVHCDILISCGNPQSFFIFVCVLGIFYWTIIKKIKSSFGKSHDSYGVISSFGLDIKVFKPRH